VGFIDKAKARFAKDDRAEAATGDATDTDDVPVEPPHEEATTSDELLHKAKAAIDKLLE
jgi:hypothetical protein